MTQMRTNRSYGAERSASRPQICCCSGKRRFFAARSELRNSPGLRPRYRAVAIEAACQQRIPARQRDGRRCGRRWIVDGPSLNLPPLFGRTSIRRREAIQMSPVFATPPSRAPAPGRTGADRRSAPARCDDAATVDRRVDRSAPHMMHRVVVDDWRRVCRRRCVRGRCGVGCSPTAAVVMVVPGGLRSRGAVPCVGLGGPCRWSSCHRSSSCLRSGARGRRAPGAVGDVRVRRHRWSLPCARPLTDVAVATVVAEPT